MPRTSRAKPAQPTSVIASMAEARPGGMTALMPMASSRLGNARKMSKNWERTASVLPPKYPAIRPKKMPMTRERNEAMIPTEREMREPEITREKMSRPLLSVPNMWSARAAASGCPGPWQADRREPERARPPPSARAGRAGSTQLEPAYAGQIFNVIVETIEI